MRDFIYNKSDLLVALVIILIAGTVIFFRVNAIMDYPAKNVGEGGSSSNASVLPVDDKDKDKDKAAETDKKTDAKDAAKEDSKKEDADTEKAESDSDKKTSDGDKAATSTVKKDTQFTINEGEPTGTVADNLATAGLVSSKQDFLSEVMAQNADTKIRAGTFTIPRGATAADIVAILVK
ncbi:MAG: hypothetical protein LBN34_03145 [Clostridiales Family XIII bacterium]|nr:hypothetical protein [Clostridiales Family XIII bacterium]